MRVQRNDFLGNDFALPTVLSYDLILMIKRCRSALLLAFAVLVLTSCQSLTPASLLPKSPEVLLINITPLDATIFEQRLKVDLRVRNPNNFDLEMTGLDFTLHFNEQRLARGLTNQSSTIPRLGDTVLSVETTTSTFDVVRQFLNFSDNQNLAYQVSGVVHTLEVELPFENKGILMDTSHSSDSPTGS